MDNIKCPICKKTRNVSEYVFEKARCKDCLDSGRLAFRAPEGYYGQEYYTESSKLDSDRIKPGPMNHQMMEDVVKAYNDLIALIDELNSKDIGGERKLEIMGFFERHVIPFKFFNGKYYLNTELAEKYKFEKIVLPTDKKTYKPMANGTLID